jgi:hypothetical protein
MSDMHLNQLIESLPSSSMTTRLLGAMDYLVPGEWENIVNFEEMIKKVTGEEDPSVIQKVGERAMELWYDEANGYQRAVSIYNLVDSGSTMAGVTSMAAKLAEDVSWLGFLDSVTPKPETSQAIDAALKLTAEIAAFCCSNGLPGDGVGDFVSALVSAEKEDVMRLASWVALDCILPLGPDFALKLGEAVGSAMDKLEASPLYGRISGFLPGGGVAEKAEFVKDAVGKTSSWATDFASSKGISQEGILEKVKGYLEGAEGKMDYAAAIIDMSTNVFEHTGTQSIARRVIRRAYNEL